MQEPVLVIMAAGLGSRFGGIKQMEPVGSNGEWMLDYSLFDAWHAGFRRGICIVRAEILDDFRKTVGKRFEKKLQMEYALQDPNDLPEGFVFPEGREKPWGTGHAVYSARQFLHGTPFMVINADDYYGPQAFRLLYEKLQEAVPNKHYMVGYHLANTVTENGSVARGICEVQQDKLIKITERTNIMIREGCIAYSENELNWTLLEHETPVSLNCWGFHPEILAEMESGFKNFLRNILPQNPLRAEYYLPSVVECALERGAAVEVLHSQDRWYGVTYQQDKPDVIAALQNLREQGVYPQNLWI